MLRLASARRGRPAPGDQPRASLAFLLLYRDAEALLLKRVTPFLPAVSGRLVHRPAARHPWLIASNRDGFHARPSAALVCWRPEDAEWLQAAPQVPRNGYKPLLDTLWPKVKQPKQAMVGALPGRGGVEGLIEASASASASAVATRREVFEIA